MHSRSLDIFHERNRVYTGTCQVLSKGLLTQIFFESPSPTYSSRTTEPNFSAVARMQAAGRNPGDWRPCRKLPRIPLHFIRATLAIDGLSGRNLDATRHADRRVVAVDDLDANFPDTRIQRKDHMAALHPAQHCDASVIHVNVGMIAFPAQRDVIVQLDLRLGIEPGPVDWSGDVDF